MNCLITLHEHQEEQLQSQGHTEVTKFCLPNCVVQCVGKYIRTPISPHLTIFIHQQPD